MTKKLHLMFVCNRLEVCGRVNAAKDSLGNFRKVSSNRTAASSLKSLKI